MLVAVSATAGNREHVTEEPAAEPPQWKPRIESPDDYIFLAPFVSASFLEAVAATMTELRILSERSVGVYYDKKTQLVWAANDNGRDIDWRRAQDYCYELELAGFDDWRLPTLAELEDLMEPISTGLYSTPDKISLSTCCVWSSTLNDQSKDQAAWNFNFRFSKRFSGSLTYSYDLRALCVRQWNESDQWDPLVEPEVPAIQPQQLPQ